jgi:hypothetical protein
MDTSSVTISEEAARPQRQDRIDTMHRLLAAKNRKNK